MEGNALTNLTTAFTWITTNMTSMVTLMLGEPVFLLPVAVTYAGAAIGLCCRLIGR